MNTLLDYNYRDDPLWLHVSRKSTACEHLPLLSDVPISFPGDFWLDDIPIQQLTGGPLYVGFRYAISDTQVTSLYGSPLTIHDSFFCCNINITSLEGGPLYVGCDYHCHGIPNLNSLKGIAQYIGNNLYISFDTTRSPFKTREDVL